MADEVEQTDEGGVTVEVLPDTDKPGKPQLSDEEVEKLADVPEDEVSRYAKDAQKRIKSLHVVNQEWRRRVVQSTKDVATATSLAEQLYRENQQLRDSVGRSETALIEQAIQRAESQLERAKTRARLAYAANDAEEIVAANEEVSRFVAEADRLRLLKPAAQKVSEQEAAAPAGPAPQAQPPSAGVQSWIQRNPWFNAPGNEEITGFAMGVHQSLEKQGITEASDPEKYWSTIDRRLREVYPQRFKPAEAKAEVKAEDKGETTVAVEQPRRPVTVVGSTRVNGSAPARPRHVQLTESQVRIAKSLGLTNEQYAAQLVKEGKEGRGTIQ